MTQEQLVALVSAIYTIIIFINNTKLGKSIISNKNKTEQKVDNEVKVLKEELSNRDQRIDRLENQLSYYNGKRIRDLKLRLEMTNDEKESQDIIDELETLSKFR